MSISFIELHFALTQMPLNLIFHSVCFKADHTGFIKPVLLILDEEVLIDLDLTLFDLYHPIHLRYVVLEIFNFSINGI